MQYPTEIVGNAAAVQLRVVKTGCCRLLAVVGMNNGTGVDPLFVQIHETAAEPAANAVPRFHFPIDANRPFSFALPTAVDLSACTIVVSSVLGTYTAAAGTPASIQAILRA